VGRFLFIVFICTLIVARPVSAEKINLACEKYKITYHCISTGARCERSDEMVHDGDAHSLIIDTDRKRLTYEHVENVSYVEQGSRIKFYLISLGMDIHLTLDRVSGEFTVEYRKSVKNHKQKLQFANIDEKGFGTEVTNWFRCELKKALF